MSKVEELEKRVEWLELQMRLVHRTLDKIDRKTEPHIVGKHADVITIDESWYKEEPKDEPQTVDSRSLSYWKDRGEKKYLDDKYLERIRPHDPHKDWVEDEPQTDCAWK